MIDATEASERFSTEDSSSLELRDGTAVIVHPARARDHAAVDAFVDRLSAEAITSRFLAVVSREAVVREVFASPETDERLSLLMETREIAPRVVGHGEYFRYRRDPDRAEVAFLVADSFRDRGVATLLLQELARRARSAGIRWLSAIVMAENLPMRDALLRSGFPYRVVLDEPALLIELSLGDGPAAPPVSQPSWIDAVATVGWCDPR